MTLSSSFSCLLSDHSWTPGYCHHRHEHQRLPAMFVKLIGKRKSKPKAKSDGSGTQSTEVIIAPSPRISVVGHASKTTHFSSLSIQQAVPIGKTLTLESLPAIRDVGNPEKPAYFLKKLRLCCYVFDFSNPSKNVKEKEMKRQTLVELVDYVGTAGKLTEQAIEESCRMISSNLFRALPPPFQENTSSDSFDPDEEEVAVDPAWPHLEIVYEFLLCFVTNQETDAKVIKRYLDHYFVLRLLDLFESEDPRERQYLKTIVHRIYGRFMVHRPFIRKAIDDIFCRFAFETEKHNGVCELLEIVGSIVIGFATPLKEEHKLFLARALIPLHKPKCVPLYHQQLSYCIAQFVEKDLKLADMVVRGLLKYWPATNSQKELLFLGELEEVLEATQSTELQRCMIPLFRQIGNCLSSSHFQVAERALFLWSNDHIVNMIVQNRRTILPLLFKHLEANVDTHWNQAVQSLTHNVRTMFQDTDPELFHECQREYEHEGAKARVLQEKRDRAWKLLEALALSKSEGSPL